MQLLEVCDAVRPIYGSLGVKRLIWMNHGSRRIVVLTLRNVTGRFWRRNVPPARREELRFLCFCACYVKNAYKYKIRIKILDF